VLWVDLEGELQEAALRVVTEAVPVAANEDRDALLQILPGGQPPRRSWRQRVFSACASVFIVIAITLVTLLAAGWVIALLPHSAYPPSPCGPERPCSGGGDTGKEGITMSGRSSSEDVNGTYKRIDDTYRMTFALTILLALVLAAGRTPSCHSTSSRELAT
jgi:hypothetical protein